MNSSKGSALHIKALEAGVCVWWSGCVLPLKFQDPVNEIVKGHGSIKKPLWKVRHCWTKLCSKSGPLIFIFWVTVTFCFTSSTPIYSLPLLFYSSHFSIHPPPPLLPVLLISADLTDASAISNRPTSIIWLSVCVWTEVEKTVRRKQSWRKLYFLCHVAHLLMVCYCLPVCTVVTVSLLLERQLLVHNIGQIMIVILYENRNWKFLLCFYMTLVKGPFRNTCITIV